jgi:hypothetical protein
MHRTPPVVVRVQPQRAVQCAVALVAVLASGGLVLLLMAHRPLTWPLLLAVLPVAAWAWREAAPLPRRLRWDGEAWWLSEPGRADELPVQLRVVIDLDRWLLLATGPARRWLPLSRSQQTAHWGALRATLFAARGGLRP